VRVIATGSRVWRDCDLIYGVFDDLLRPIADYAGELVVVHGGATGADSWVDAWARGVRAAGRPVQVERFPVTTQEWDRHGKRAGILRNERMVDAGADLVVAFPLPGGRGTQHCMRYAQSKGIPVRNYGRLR
jgi:hypothetical protein